MEFPLFIVVAFASFGVSYIIRYTDGPFHIFVNFRKLVGINKIYIYEAEVKPDEFIEEVSGNFFAQLFSCFWCITTWVSLALTLIVDIWWVEWLACIGISGFLHEIIVRNDG